MFTRLARFFLPLSALLVVASIVLAFVPGPILSIEFTGGTLIEVSLPANTTKAQLETALNDARIDGAPLTEKTITRTKTGTYFTRVQTLTNEQHTDLLAQLQKAIPALDEVQYTTIGPTVGQNLKSRSFMALGVASAAILIFIAFSFRKVKGRISSWAFGAAAIAALVHDIVILMGVFTILSHVTTFQVDTLFVTALLSIMGHSVSDTIVIFDRIRETLAESDKRASFDVIANQALSQCISRTINTGLGVIIMLTALFFFGAESIQWFILTLIIGTVVGMYSSYFIATPLLALWEKRQRA